MIFDVFLTVFGTVLEAFEFALKLVMMGNGGFYHLTIAGPFVPVSDTKTTKMFLLCRFGLRFLLCVAPLRRNDPSVVTKRRSQSGLVGPLLSPTKPRDW